MRKKRDIIIELTSLLDVIMIMIFMVMTENSKLITEKQSTVDEVKRQNSELSSQLSEAQAKLSEGSVEELLERLQKAESKLDGYEYMDDVVTVIHIGLENRYANTVRCLTFGTAYNSQDTNEQMIEIRDTDELSAAINQMRVFIHEHISEAMQDESAIVYLVFSYDPSKVYQDDYAAVNAALNEAESRANSGNVRYRINRIAI